MSSPPAPSLSRRSSLAERISSALPPIAQRLRSRKSNVSVNSVRANSTLNGSTTTKHKPYSVYQQSMYPPILRDADATSKLLEAVIDVPAGRRVLARIARTCKAFKEPALDLLWKDLDSLSPLIALFPNTLLKRARRPGLGLAKNPEPDDWSRLLSYGERVRSLSYVEASGAIAPSIFPVFEELRPRQWLLPNLTSLTWKSETAAGLERCRLFLGPELQSLTLEVGTKHPRLNELLREVATHKRLSSLSFTLHTNLPDTFTHIFQRNVALERVALTAPGALASSVGKWAASLPALRTLELDLTGRSPIAVEGFFDDISPGSGYSTPASVGSGTDSGVFSGDELDFSEVRKSAMRLTRDGPRLGAFPQLTQLQLTGELGNIAMFLRHLRSPLTQLELIIEDPPAPEDWKEVCTLICDEFSHTLLTLRIGATSASRFSELVRTTSRGGDVPTRHLPLTHLSALPRLQRLDIDLPESVLFHDADVAHLAALCPALEVLRLCAQARFPQSGRAPALTLDGLAPLTAHCQRLHTLAVVVNALEGADATLGTRAVSSRSLLRLGVGHSWIRDPLQTAVLLSHLAPHLENLKWFHEKNRTGVVEANALAWQKVAEFLPPVQALRLLERRLQPPPAVYVPPPSAEKEVDATVLVVDEGVFACPDYAEGGVQVQVQVADFSVQMSPESSSVSVDATPEVVEEGILAVPEVEERAVDASPEVEEKGIAIIPAEPEPEVASDTDSETDSSTKSTPMLPFVPSAANGLITLTFRVVRFYTFPLRYMLSFMPSMPLYPGAAAHVEAEPKSPVSTQDAPEQHVEKAPSDELQLMNISPVCQ
ncbi:hypothetical protein B0H21DRAFT_734928 [Amylocystis lapponica]|nr:hypothetical protein B0H21DRAFT_734928 [Amylocystis lapponica]